MYGDVEGSEGGLTADQSDGSGRGWDDVLVGVDSGDDVKAALGIGLIGICRCGRCGCFACAGCGG